MAFIRLDIVTGSFSGEKACRKKAISVKMTNRDTTVEAVTDIILLTKSKRPPEGYSLAGCGALT